MTAIDAMTRETLDEVGYAGPFALADPNLVAPVKAFHAETRQRRNAHVNSPAVRALLQDQTIQDVVSGLFGDGLDIWRTAFFEKAEGAAEICWHHDKHFEKDASSPVDFSDIATHFSILIAIEEISEDNGVLEFIPGAHRQTAGYDRDTRPFHMRTLEEHFLKDLPPSLEASARKITMPKATFLAFHSAIIHRSLPYRKGPARLGLAVRFARRPVIYSPLLAAARDILYFS